LPGGSLGVGVNAGSINTGSANLFVGAGAGQFNSAGEYNTFVGAGAGNNNTEGNGNSFIGRYTGYLNTSGGDNSFVGNEAGANNGTGANNTFVGATAGQSNTTGNGNSFVGSYAGLFTGGSANAIFGSQAGGYNDASNSGSFSSSTLMGYGAGYYLGTGSADNIFVGFMAGRNVTTGKRNIIIGYEQNAPLATTSDHLNIGGVLYSDLSTGNVGIGTINPGAKLEVAGDVKITGGTPAIGKVLTSDANGLATWQAMPSDNLGSHVATTTLNMAGFPIANISTITITGGGLAVINGTSSDSNGIYISAMGAIYTRGFGGGSYMPDARGVGSVDLQSYRVLGMDRVAAGTYSTIAGGIDNKIIAGSINGFIGAGDRNTFSSGVQNSVIVGGYNNIMGGSHAFIGGGYGNTAGSAYATVGAGMSNIAASQYSSVLGGNTNRVIDIWSEGSVIPGGANNTVTYSKYTLAAGYWASNYYADGTFTWNDYHGTNGNSELINNVPQRTLFKNRGGFMITGSTNTVIGGIKDRGVFITGDGLVGISTGSPKAALDIVSAGSYAQIWRNSAGTIVSSMTDTGMLYPKGAVSGDDLGNHTATTALNMATFDIAGVSTIAVNGRVGIGTANPNNRLQVVDYINFDDTLYNTMLGYRAGYQTTAGWNTFIGHQAGYNNVGGVQNVTLGKNSLFSSASGDDNTVVGYAALDNNSGGSRNAVLGSLAGMGTISQSNFSDNTLLGYRAGYALMSGGTNVLIGSMAGDSITTGFGNIIIGYGQDAPSATTNNYLNIGGVIYGDLSGKTVAIPKYTTEAADSGVTLTAADFGKTITVSASGAQTVTLPPVSASDIGAQVTVVKLGIGQVTIQVTGSGVTIADSNPGGNITNNVSGENYASITLRLVTDMKWIITGGNGSWTTN